MVSSSREQDALHLATTVDLTQRAVATRVHRVEGLFIFAQLPIQEQPIIHLCVREAGHSSGSRCLVPRLGRFVWPQHPLAPTHNAGELLKVDRPILVFVVAGQHPVQLVVRQPVLQLGVA